MTLDIGFDAQVPSLPQGGGAMSSLGATFAPDLSTGTGSLSIPLDLPNGPNDIGPRLALRYDTTGGNGPFGMGFSLPLPRLMRSIATGFPSYEPRDSITLEGAGPLVALGQGRYRPQVDGGAWQIEASGGGFRLTDRDGLYYFLGTDQAGQLSDSGSSRVFAWHLERIEDSIGNSASFTWMRDQNQLYLSTVAYGAYEVRFNYENRPDPIRWGRAGFLVQTALRCSNIELRMPADPQPLLRRWTFSYEQHEADGSSLLVALTLSGFDENGARLDAPALALGYSSFQPRSLTSFQSVDEAESPGTLSRIDRRVDLVDWNGNGLPDLLEISGGGKARVWPNMGDCIWGHPRMAGQVPLFATADAAMAFIDMDGDGIADLVRADQSLGGYVPRLVGGGFGRPVQFAQAPAAVLTAPNVRLADLDGDGVADLMSSNGDYLELYYRVDAEGWSEQPQVLTLGAAPIINLADRHVFLADMTGDGSQDLVRVDGGGLTYWPYLGFGRWDQPVVMEHPPELPYDFEPARLYLTDIDGDGCADLVYLGQGRVLCWINQSGNRVSAPFEIDYLPVGQFGDFRFADMRGSGTSGILWSTTRSFAETLYYYLDFTGDAKPYLLTRIDNGVGLSTNISYSTSAQQWATDAASGSPWPTIQPVVIPVVSATVATDAATGLTTRTEYRYHHGRYDGVLREFAGFGRVDEDAIGDSTAPTLRTTRWFHTGVDPADPTEPESLDDRQRLRAIRGRLYRQERLGLDGSPSQTMPYDRIDHQWTVVAETTAGGTIWIPRLVTTVRSNFERQATAATTVTIMNTAWDAVGNLTDSLHTSEVPGDPAQTQSLRTHIEFASDQTGRFLSRIWRVQQFDNSGSLIADSVTQYDGTPDAGLGAQGLISKRSLLVVSDTLVSQVYGGSLPDFASLGYYRRAGEQGWWIDEAAYQRTEDATGLHGRVTGPRGGQTTFDFDANKTYPAKVTDPLGNTITAQHDYRVSHPLLWTDASGGAHLAVYDALARLVAEVEPLDTAALPTLSYEHNAAAVPNELTTHRRAASAATATIDAREFYDGAGRLIEHRVRDETGEIIMTSHVYSARGLLARSYVESRAASAAYSPPSASTPHFTFIYDALGRIVGRQNPDGSFRSITYGPNFVVEADEEDTRTSVGAIHSGTPTRKLLDSAGRVRTVQENLAGRPISSSYQYDSKGNLVVHTDPLGNMVRIWYDFMGHKLRVDRPEHGQVLVFDAAGNPVQTRARAGSTVFRDFDQNNRPVAVRYDSPGNSPVIQYTYHDNGRLAPPDAGTHTSGGRLVRVDDEGGTTTFDYDERGNLALKRSRPAGISKTYDLNFQYRADGQIAATTYPDDGNGRLVVRYQYNARGNVSSIPSVVAQIDYDPAGRRTHLRYANGVDQAIAYDQTTSRQTSMQLSGPTRNLRSVQYTCDLVGNIVRLDSPDPKLAATYLYDDLYRLTEARTDSAQTWSYGYDDAGNLISKSDVGTFHYGENGNPATCLTSAGSMVFSYNARGQMQNTPWGQLAFDPQGQLTSIVGSGATGRMDFVYDSGGIRVATTSSGSAPPVNRLTPDPHYSIEAGVLVLNLFDGSAFAARRTSGGGMVFLHFDHLGSLVAVSDGAGQVVDSLRYDPYGLLIERTGSGALQPEGFTGGTADPWSGLLYLTARYYHPSIGRFISPDNYVVNPLDPIMWSAYAYCRDNPISYADPSGHGTWLPAILAIIAIVILAVIVTIASFGSAAPEAAAGGTAAATGVAGNAVAAGTAATTVAASSAAAGGLAATIAAATPSIIIGTVTGALVGFTATYIADPNANWQDLLTATLVGAAVGGWSALGGAAAASAFDAGKLGGAIGAGAIKGTISGAGTGFTTTWSKDYATGKYNSSATGEFWDVLTKSIVGGLAGAAYGGLIGGAQYSLTHTTTTIISPNTITTVTAERTTTPAEQNFYALVRGAGTLMSSDIKMAALSPPKGASTTTNTQLTIWGGIVSFAFGADAGLLALG